MTTTFIRPLVFSPGIDRDGTNFSRTAYTDGEWVRFYRDRPRKIGGYQMIVNGTDTIIRSMATCASDKSDIISNNGIIRMFLGRYDSVFISDINYSASFSSHNVTPVTREEITVPPETKIPIGCFEPHPDNLWNIDFMTINAATHPESTKETKRILENIAFAFVGRNANNTGSLYQPEYSGDVSKQPIVNACVFYQIQNGSTKSEYNKFIPLYIKTPPKVKPSEDTGQPLPPSTNHNVKYTETDLFLPSVSGGLCVAGNFLFLYGSDGYVAWSSPGDPFVFPINQVASISKSKIVKGVSTRGGGTIALLFWSMTDVILAQFNPTSVPVQSQDSQPSYNIYTYSFSFDTLRTDVSIISANSVVEYNGNFFWAGLNQFYVYNGTVQSLPNTMNKRYFFEGINPKHASKVWGVSNPQYDEITWYYPRGENTECSHFITYNVAGNFWYDGELGRSAGFSSELFLYPVLADSGVNARTEYPKYGIWRHESGNNAVYSLNEQDIYPIKSSFTTPVIMLGKENPQNDVMLLTRRMEPDFREIGDYRYEHQTLRDEEEGALNPMEFQILTKNYAHSKRIISQSHFFDEFTPYINITGSQGRQVQYKFISNVKDGSYQAGDTIITYSSGDVRSG